MPLHHLQNLALKAMITCPGGSIRTLRGDPNVKKASLINLFKYNGMGPYIHMYNYFLTLKVLNEAYPSAVDENELPGKRICCMSHNVHSQCNQAQ